MNTSVVLGIFSTRDQASLAIDDLEQAGFDAKDISIILKDKDKGEIVETTDEAGSVAEGTVSGAVGGGVLGGLAGLLIGVGAIAIPGIGAVLIGGPLAAALGLTGVAATTVSGAVTGALAGGLVGALVGWGVPEEEAKLYEERIMEGGVLVAVPITHDNENKVREILEENEADQIRTIEKTAD